MQLDETSAVVKNELREYRVGLDPVALLRSIREAQSAMAAMSSPQFQGVPLGESIDRFLASLPNLWQQGEARPTHRDQVRSIRHWRTRKDPFEGVWRDAAVVASERPRHQRQGPAGKLCRGLSGPVRRCSMRTLKRRVKDWRGVMAKGLLYPASDEPASEPSEKVESVLVGLEIRARISVTFSGEAIRRHSLLSLITMSTLALSTRHPPDSTPKGVACNNYPGRAVDESHGAAGHLPASRDQPTGAGASGLSLPVEECQNHPAQPGLGRRITYLPMARGFLYLLSIMDRHSRHVVAWRLSNTLEAGFCAEALEEALSQGRPEVFNTDQGSQFTSLEFTQVLKEQG